MLQIPVFLARVNPAQYIVHSDLRFPELRPDIPVTTSLVALRKLLVDAGLDQARFGSIYWNPFGDLVGPGSRVLVKPNWVHHPRPCEDSLNSLVTHSHVIAAVLAYLEKVPGCNVVIGDAPVQGCEFEKLLTAYQIQELVHLHRSSFARLNVVDFRKTIWERGNQGKRSRQNCRSDEHFVMFDLAESSYLENISNDAHRFRVTVYNPELLLRTHAPGRHRYLVAKEALEADLGISLDRKSVV